MRWKPSQWNLLDRAMILVAVPFFVECALLSWLVSVHNLRQEQARSESLSRQIIQLSNELTQDLYAVGPIVQKSTVRPNSHPSEFYTNVSIGVPRKLERLRDLTADNPRVAHLVEDMEKGAMFIANDTARVQAEVRAHPDKDTQGILHTEYWPAFQQVTDSAEKLHNYVDPLTQEARAKQLELMQRTEQVVLGGLVTNVLLALGLAVFFARSTTARLAVVIDNTRRIADKQPLHKALAGSDEIAYLDKIVSEVGMALHDLEERERALINNAMELLCSLDADQRFVYANAACQRLLGYTRRELSTLSLSQLVAEKDSAMALTTVKNMTASLGSGEFACRLVRKDGKLIDTLWVCQWSADEGVLLSVVHDISARVRLENARQNLVAMVTHDLRTPLNTVIAFYEILSATDMLGTLNEQGQVQVLAARENLETMMRSISDLLDLERAEAGQLELEIGEWQAAELLERAAAQIRAGNIRLALPDIKQALHVDGERICHVLVHVLQRALKRTPAPGQVDVEATTTANKLLITVTDGGTNLSQNQLDTLFERFKPKEDAIPEESGQTFALALGREIVHRHGGTIAATATSISIQLPLN